MLILIYLILMASKSLCVYSVPSGPPETAKNVEVNKAISLRYRITQAKVEISGLNRKRCSMSVALTYVCLFRRNFFLSFFPFVSPFLPQYWSPFDSRTGTTTSTRFD